MANSFLTKNLHWYEIEPLDLILIREAKPFNPGDGSWAKGQFPPPPLTVFQALRSVTPQRLSQRTERNLEFLGPFLLHEALNGDKTLWLPTPKDLLAQFPHAVEGEVEPSAAAATVARLCPIDLHDEMQFVSFDAAHFSQSLTPLLPPASSEYGYGRLQPWMNAERLVDYLQGQLSQLQPTDFCDNPWSVQVLPHIQIQADTRQVKEQDGYFTEVAVRLNPGWKLVAGLSDEIQTPVVVRLGGEGHRALVGACPVLPVWTKLQAFTQPQDGDIAYLLTPGLAEVGAGSDIYGTFPASWGEQLHGCATDRPILWGGISVLQRPNDTTASVGFTPQRAFVPPGTVYRFKQSPENAEEPLLPRLSDRPTNWLKTFHTLGYGTLLWNRK